MNDGGPAFPFYCTDMHIAGNPGMSLRDWFAGMALQGFVSSAQHMTNLYDTIKSKDGEEFINNPDKRNDVIDRVIVKTAYRLADAMLRARQQT